MSNYDVNDLFLSDEELNTLRKILESDGISDKDMCNHPYDRLLRYGLIVHCYLDRFPYEIPDGWIEIPANALTVSDKGRFLLAKTEKEIQEKSTLSWRYWVTTGIAILAFITSAIALLLQLGILKLPTP